MVEMVTSPIVSDRDEIARSSGSGLRKSSCLRTERNKRVESRKLNQSTSGRFKRHDKTQRNARFLQMGGRVEKQPYSHTVQVGKVGQVHRHHWRLAGHCGADLLVNSGHVVKINSPLR